MLLAAVLSGGMFGCREIPVDRTYALWLDHAPSDADWAGALPREVLVRGGRPHRLQSFTEIDDDTVHATTASCHHGSRIPEPVTVDVRAFYTDRELFLQLSWDDETRDQAMRDWSFDGQSWVNTGALEDGIGVLWDAGGQFKDFSCTYACHITDFGVDRANFHASNKMKLNREGSWLDLWNWKAARTGLQGFADDRYLDNEGMHGDVPGELFIENSRASAESGLLRAFSDGDAPLFSSDGTPLSEAPAPGSRAPGYLTTPPTASRADVAATSRHDAGRWIVTLRRALNTGHDKDVVFVPGDQLGVAFGLALMDHSLYEHYASRTSERLVLMKPE